MRPAQRVMKASRTRGRRAWLSAGLVTSALWLCPTAAAGTDPAMCTMRAVFAGLDKDASGTINLTEASGSGLDPKTFGAFDHDGGGSIDRDEFTLLYRRLLIDAGRKVPKSIADEAARVCARRRLRKKGKR